MSFHEVRFPDDISYGSTGGPGYSTTILTTSSGVEQRIQNWAQTRCSYNVAHGVKNKSQLQQLLSFFHARKGKAYGFRFKDWSDYRAAEQVCTAISGSTTIYQLQKTYTDNVGFTASREIKKPVAGTVRIYVDGVLKASGYTLDYTTGRIIFNAAPSGIVTADFEFDVPCRLDVDTMPINLEDFNSYSWSGITIVEIKSPANVMFFNVIPEIELTDMTMVTVDHVEELKRTVNLKAGMKVRTRGRNMVGDGGGADYSIQAADGGKSWAIQLNNGLYALISNKDSVTYRMFGANLNGIDDDTPYMRQAHEYANSIYVVDNTGSIKIRTCKVEQHDGTIYRKSTGPIEVYTDLNLSGATIVIDNHNSSPNGWYSIGESISEAYSMAFSALQKAQLLVSTSYFTMTDNSIPSNIAIKLKETKYAKQSTGSTLDRKELLVHDMHGICAGPLIASWTDAGGQNVGGNTTVFNATYSYINPKPLTVTGCDILINSSTNNNVSFMYINRHNVIVKDFLIRPHRNMLNNESDKGALFNFRDSYNIAVENIRGFNVAGRINKKEGYILSFDCCADITISRCRLMGYFMPVYLINVKDIKIFDSDISGVYAHDYFSHLRINNCRIYHHGVTIGFGTGVCSVTDCKFYYYAVSDMVYSEHVFELVTATGRLFTGELILKNCNIVATKKASDYFHLIDAAFELGTAIVPAIPFKLPEIRLRDIVVESDHTYLLFMQYAGSHGSTLSMFRKATFENIESNIALANTYVISFNAANVTTALSGTYSKVIVHNCGTGINKTTSPWFGKISNPVPTTVNVGNA